MAQNDHEIAREARKIKRLTEQLNQRVSGSSANECIADLYCAAEKIQTLAAGTENEDNDAE